MLTKQMTHVVQ